MFTFVREIRKKIPFVLIWTFDPLGFSNWQVHIYLDKVLQTEDIHASDIIHVQPAIAAVNCNICLRLRTTTKWKP
jgi:hypothetical protein